MHWGRQSPCVHCSAGEAARRRASVCPTGETCGQDLPVLCDADGARRISSRSMYCEHGPQNTRSRKRNDFVVESVSAAPRRSLLSPHHRHPKRPAEIVVKPACAESEEGVEGWRRGTPPPRRPPHRVLTAYISAPTTSPEEALPPPRRRRGQRLELRRHAAAVEPQLVRVVRAQLEIVRDRDRRDAAARAPGDAHTCACTCTHARAHAHAHTCTCTCACTHMHTYAWWGLGLRRGSGEAWASGGAQRDAGGGAHPAGSRAAVAGSTRTEHSRLTTRATCCAPGEELRLERGLEVGGRLVEHGEARPLQAEARRREALLAHRPRAPRTRPRRAARPAWRRGGRGPPSRGPRHARAVGRGGGGVGRRGRGGVEEELGERGLGRRVRTLRHEEDPRRGRQRHDGALCRGPHARQHAEQRGLARAVWPRTSSRRPLSRRSERPWRSRGRPRGRRVARRRAHSARAPHRCHRRRAAGGAAGEREGGVQCLEARGETARGRERLAR